MTSLKAWHGRNASCFRVPAETSTNGWESSIFSTSLSGKITQDSENKHRTYRSWAPLGAVWVLGERLRDGGRERRQEVKTEWHETSQKITHITNNSKSKLLNHTTIPQHLQFFFKTFFKCREKKPNISCSENLCVMFPVVNKYFSSEQNCFSKLCFYPWPVVFCS